MSGISVDITGAVKKTQVLKTTPQATKYELMRFGTDTVQSLKRSATAMKRSDRYHRKTGAMSRSVGLKLESVPDGYRLFIGTGIGTAAGSKGAEKYAMIQDRGGVTHPTVTSRMKKWAWYMFYRYKESKFKAIALTKKSKLTVRIPPSGWFTGPWEHKLSFLKTNYLNDKVIYSTAERMSGGEHAE
jgi:hypothetical protein